MLPEHHGAGDRVEKRVGHIGEGGEVEVKRFEALKTPFACSRCFPALALSVQMQKERERKRKRKRPRAREARGAPPRVIPAWLLCHEVGGPRAQEAGFFVGTPVPSTEWVLHSFAFSDMNEQERN